MTVSSAAETRKTNGAPLAALLAAGIGVFLLGFFTTFAEANAGFKTAMTLTAPVGPLSGKTTYAVVGWLLAWVVAYAVMRGKDYAQRPLFIATFVLIGLGFLGTFPIFFEAFAP